MVEFGGAGSRLLELLIGYWLVKKQCAGRLLLHQNLKKGHPTFKICCASALRTQLVEILQNFLKVFWLHDGALCMASVHTLQQTHKIANTY
jgi:hypothetical protein